jgi:phospholipid/cholesterol/gamma-HCH transport system substrate-binding protein
MASRSAAIDGGVVNASRALESAARVTAQLTADLPRIMERLQRSAETFDKMSNEVERAGSNVTRFTEATRDDVHRFTTAVLPEVQSLLNEAHTLTGSLKRIAEDMERNPSVLLYGKRPPRKGPGE